MEAWFGDKKLDGLSIASDIGGGLLIPTDLLNKPGIFPVYLIHTPSKSRIELGSFEVTPKPNDVPQLNIQRWGPESTMVGEVFNVQPNGVSALWFQMTGSVYANTLEAWFGDNKLDGLVVESGKGGGILVPTNLLVKPGRFPVYLIHTPSMTRLDLGVFEVVQKAPK